MRIIIRYAEDLSLEEKRTLYDYLYRNLKEQILNGYFACGERLPSLNELCEMYHVGIRTAKDVIRALKEEGLIKTEERKPSYVTYCRPQCTPDYSGSVVKTKI